MRQYTPAAEPAPILEQYGRFFDAHTARFTEESPLALRTDTESRKKRYEVHPRFGSGWTDMHEFGNGVLVGRMHCRFSQTFEDEYASFPDNTRLSIRLAGHGALIHAQRVLTGEAGDILVRNANPGVLRNRIHGDSLFAGIAVDIPRAMLETLQEQGLDTSCLGKPDSCAILAPAANLSSRLRHLGWRMLGLRTQDSLLAAIELESLGLDLLLEILSACPPRRSSTSRLASRHWLTALDDAMDILHAEWNQPLTIAALARRAGMNECYLKMFFRQRTGQSVAAYLRSLRMRRARDMMESNQYTVQQVAQFCGYLHAGKFSQAFRREYGFAPSELR